MNVYRVAFFVAALVPITSAGQEFPAKEYDPELLAEEIFPVQDGDLNYEDLYENLVQRLSNPLDLNLATAEELRSIFVLNEQQIAELLSHRSKSKFISVYELQSLRSFDLATIYKLVPFVKVHATPNEGSLLKRLIQKNNTYLLLRLERTLEEKKGFAETDSAKKYLGSPEKYYLRFRSSRAADFSYGITAENDAGEQWRWNEQQQGFDFLSAHVQLLNQGIVKNVVLGDYQTQYGQGLVVGGGFGMGKGAETITTLRRSNTGIMPYTSLNESGFFRGGAISLSPVEKIRLDLFASNLANDASIQEDSAGNERVSAFIRSGLHRTLRELESRKKVREQNYGSVLEYRGETLQIGAIAHRTIYEADYNERPSLYNQFSLQESTNTNGSIFFNLTARNFVFFGEAAHTQSKGSAFVAGFMGSVSRSVDVSLLLRKYDRNFITNYGNALSEGTLPQNEEGCYWGWKFTPTKKTAVTGYIDLFRFPWLRYRVYAPSQGSEWLVKWLYKPSRGVQFYIQVRQEDKQRNQTNDGSIFKTIAVRKQNLWLNADYGTGVLKFKSRIQMSRFLFEQTTTGFAIVQDVSTDLGKISLTGRYALFDTDDFENRQYVYERDLWLAFSLPAYQGVGIRVSGLIHFQLNKNIDLWLRWAQTSYANKSIIGSGGEEIAGNSRNDVKFQLRLKL